MGCFPSLRTRRSSHFQDDKPVAAPLANQYHGRSATAITPRKYTTHTYLHEGHPRSIASQGRVLLNAPYQRAIEKPLLR